MPAPAGRVTSNNRNSNVRWDYNLYPIKQDVVTGSNDIVAEPQFVKIARDSGTDELPQRTDLAGVARPAGKARDRGAYEQGELRGQPAEE